MNQHIIIISLINFQIQFVTYHHLVLSANTQMLFIRTHLRKDQSKFT